jgi:hypothetical protein
MSQITRARPQSIDPSTVKGWGVDADPRNDPTYPYRERIEAGGRPMDWERPTLQRTEVEVLRSIEHNRRPAVVGTSTPPSGVSGAIRRAAFAYSESDWRHWLMLMGADRVNVVEGLLDDLARGRIPNIPGEMGLRAEWRHNRAGLARKVAVAAALSAVAVALWQRRGAQPRRENAREVPGRAPGR